MSGERILRVPILPSGLVNAHLILGSSGVVLVDAGLPGSEAKVGKALRKAGLSFRDIRLIVVTHAHVDHAGGAARLRELSGAPILAHAGDLAHYERRAPMAFCPTGWFGRLFLKTGLMVEPYEAFTPDLLLSGSDGMDLGTYGIRGSVRPTPGHTEGSISVELASKSALVGDLIASGILLGGLACTGRAKQPPFEDDARAVGGVLRQMVEAGHARFYMGHGGPLDAQEVSRHAESLLARARPVRADSQDPHGTRQ